MADIKPFRGYLYNPRKVKDIATVLAPPYDVITPVMQEDLYQKNDYNIVRVIFGKDEPGDDGAQNKYKRANTFLEEMIQRDILVRDAVPALYIFDQEYQEAGKEKHRIGFIALIRLEDRSKNKVLPHERTFRHPKQDRLRLMRQVKGNTSPIFSIFEDKGRTVTAILEREAARPPIFDVRYDGVRQRMWRIEDRSTITAIQRAMKPKSIFIADGHHRYETALIFRDEMSAKRAGGGGGKPYDYVMMYFAGFSGDTLTIMATHRVIKDTGGLSCDAITSRLRQHFTLSRFERLDQMLSAQRCVCCPCAFGMYCGDNQYYVISVDDVNGIERSIRKKKSSTWKQLDVTILHDVIIKNILKIDDAEGNVMYLRDAEVAMREVNEGSGNVAFFLNPTKLEQVKAIAQGGEKMPHKSTYFYPKLPSGIVINKFDK